MEIMEFLDVTDAAIPSHFGHDVQKKMSETCSNGVSQKLAMPTVSALFFRATFKAFTVTRLLPELEIPTAISSLFMRAD